MRFTEKYLQILSKARFISFLAVPFLIYIFSVEAFYNYSNYLNFDYESYSFDYRNELFWAFIFQFALAGLFVLRLIFLFFSTPKALLITQFLWLLAWTTIFIYFLVSQTIKYGCFNCPVNDIPKHCDDCYPTTFLAMLHVIAMWIGLYWLFSLVKQISILIFAYLYRKD